MKHFGRKQKKMTVLIKLSIAVPKQENNTYSAQLFYVLDNIKQKVLTIIY